MSASARLNRMFSPEGKCFDVAIDHDFFNEYAFLSSIENMKQAVATVVEANPDCIQLSLGQARHLQNIPGKGKSGLVLRTDAASIYGSSLLRYLFSDIINNAIEYAVRMDAVIRAGKHLLGEKPFGIDREANAAIVQALRDNPQVIVRCSSEIPFFPGALQMTKWVNEQKFGKILEVEAGFWHSSDLDPNKPINWKRRISSNGEYGCMGDLGMHVLHLPMRYGWKPNNVRALLSKVVEERPIPYGAGRARFI